MLAARVWPQLNAREAPLVATGLSTDAEVGDDSA